MKLRTHVARQLRAVANHLERKTLSVAVYVPEHAGRVETALFRRTREELLKRGSRALFASEPGQCFICAKTEKDLGAPLQAHHFGIERCFAEAKGLDWDKVKADFPNFAWSTFDPKDPYAFVDDMAAQGLLLCEEHHIGADTGIHTTTFPLWLMQRYLKVGYRYSPTEVIGK